MNSKRKLELRKEANALFKKKKFVEFYCEKEDKWLQYAEAEEKLIAIFGSVKNAISEFKRIRNCSYL